MSKEESGRKGRPKGSKNKPKRGRPKNKIKPKSNPVGRPPKLKQALPKHTLVTGSEEEALDRALTSFLSWLCVRYSLPS